MRYPRKPESWVWADGGKGKSKGLPVAATHLAPKSFASSCTRPMLQAWCSLHRSSCLNSPSVPVCPPECPGTLGARGTCDCFQHVTASRQCPLLIQLRKPLTCSGMGLEIDTGAGDGARFRQWEAGENIYYLVPFGLLVSRVVLYGTNRRQGSTSYLQEPVAQKTWSPPPLLPSLPSRVSSVPLKYLCCPL